MRMHHRLPFNISRHLPWNDFYEAIRIMLKSFSNATSWARFQKVDKKKRKKEFSQFSFFLQNPRPILKLVALENDFLHIRMYRKDLKSMEDFITRPLKAADNHRAMVWTVHHIRVSRKYLNPWRILSHGLYRLHTTTAQPPGFGVTSAPGQNCLILWVLTQDHFSSSRF